MPVQSTLILYDHHDALLAEMDISQLVAQQIFDSYAPQLMQAHAITLINTFLDVTLEELGASVHAAVDLMNTLQKPVDIISVLPAGSKFPTTNVMKMQEFGKQLFQNQWTGQVFVVVPDGVQMLAFFAQVVGRAIGYEMSRASSIEQAEERIRASRKLR